MTDDERDWYEERAAIMQHDGGLSRAEAEKHADARLKLWLAGRGAVDGAEGGGTSSALVPVQSMPPGQGRLPGCR